MAFSIRRLFSNLFLSVVIEGSECVFYGRVFKNGKSIKTLNAKFTDINPTSIDDKVIQYIKRQEEAYYAVYIALFYNDRLQGALPTLQPDEFKKFNIKNDGITSINIANEFSIYTDILGISRMRDTFGKQSIDMLYSPIALLYTQVLRRGVSEKTTLYLYNHQDSAALAIFSEQKMKFATFITTDKVDNITPSDIFKKEDIAEIEDLIIKDEEGINSIDDFKSLDDLLNSDENKTKDDFEDLGYDINMPASNNVAASVTIFGRDMNMFKYITTAIKEFYKNPLYNGTFVEQIIIFDNAKTSATFLQYLQSELLVETAVYPVDTLHIMNDLMYEELAI